MKGYFTASQPLGYSAFRGKVGKEDVAYRRHPPVATKQRWQVWDDIPLSCGDIVPTQILRRPDIWILIELEGQLFESRLRAWCRADRQRFEARSIRDFYQYYLPLFVTVWVRFFILTNIPPHRALNHVDGQNKER